MRINELRKKYLEFFRQRGHAIIPSASLLPENDPTVLFTTAGMHPLVPFLLGEPHPKGKRLTNCQKCIRTTDIDDVGDTTHLTFFEMLGNWSLGDYWKKEAITWSFEFLTSKEWLGFNPEKLSVTVFAGDDDAPRDTESAEIWKSLGVPEERIYYLPKKDNWWGPAGTTGPCGPCTEMFIEVDEIYNLACPASPIHYQYNAIKTIKTSVMGAINMLGLAKRVKAKVLQASTSEVYGDPKVHPQKEDYWGHVNPIGIRSCYDEGKRCAESLFFSYYRQNDVRIKVMRIFNTYGPRMHPNDGRVISNFIVQALQNEDITIYGDGSQTRSFCYVDDLLEGMIRLMNTPDSFTGPVNVGNPDEFTIKQLAELVIEMTGSKSKLIFKPLPEDDPLQRQPDISLAKKELGWEPSVNLETGLTKTIDYFRGII